MVVFETKIQRPIKSMPKMTASGAWNDHLLPAVCIFGHPKQHTLYYWHSSRDLSASSAARGTSTTMGQHGQLMDLMADMVESIGINAH